MNTSLRGIHENFINLTLNSPTDFNNVNDIRFTYIHTTCIFVDKCMFVDLLYIFLVCCYYCLKIEKLVLMVASTILKVIPAF